MKKSINLIRLQSVGKPQESMKGAQPFYRQKMAYSAFFDAE